MTVNEALATVREAGPNPEQLKEVQESIQATAAAAALMITVVHDINEPLFAMKQAIHIGISAGRLLAEAEIREYANAEVN